MSDQSSPPIPRANLSTMSADEPIPLAPSCEACPLHRALTHAVEDRRVLMELLEQHMPMDLIRTALMEHRTPDPIPIALVFREFAALRAENARLRQDVDHWSRMLWLFSNDMAKRGRASSRDILPDPPPRGA